MGKSGSLGGDSSGADAAKDIIAAMKAGDAKALDLALQRHYACCEDSGEYEAETDDDDAEA